MMYMIYNLFVNFPERNIFVFINTGTENGENLTIDLLNLTNSPAE